MIPLRRRGLRVLARLVALFLGAVAAFQGAIYAAVSIRALVNADDSRVMGGAAVRLLTALAWIAVVYVGVRLLVYATDAAPAIMEVGPGTARRSADECP